MKVLVPVYDLEFAIYAMMLLGSALTFYGVFRLGRMVIELIRYKNALEWKKDIIIGMICLLVGVLFLMAYLQ